MKPTKQATTAKRWPCVATRSAGTWTSTSPRVWAGPTWISSTLLLPTETNILPSKVRVGGVFTGFTEDPEYDNEQLDRFLSVVRQATAAGFDLGTRHAAIRRNEMPGQGKGRPRIFGVNPSATLNPPVLACRVAAHAGKLRSEKKLGH